MTYKDNIYVYTYFIYSSIFKSCISNISPTLVLKSSLIRIGIYIRN